MTATADYAGDDQPAIHVIPLNDWREHEASRACWCAPSPDEDEPDILLHHAMDQRERYESGELRPQ
jgi:hypothetical protein